MYIDTLTVTAMVVVIVGLVLFIARCVVRTCSAPCEDKALCGLAIFRSRWQNGPTFP